MHSADDSNTGGSSRSPTVAAVLSAVLPGLGHIRTRPVLAGFLLGLSFLTIGATVWWLGVANRVDLLAWTVEPNRLLLVAGLSLLILAVRWAVAVHAARAAGLGRVRRRWTSHLGTH